MNLSETNPHGTPMFAFCVFCNSYIYKNTKKGVRLTGCIDNRTPQIHRNNAYCCYFKEKELATC